MKMKCYFLVMLYLALNSCQGVYAIDDREVKRGMHSFMVNPWFNDVLHQAFIYFSDPSVVDVSKQRFVRSAVLIRADWLVSTAIGPSLMDPPNGFTKKTLLARAGAIAIDSKFTLNEDEDEQEREIIQIVRPYNHSATQWWTTDISLMKTLLPFKMTSAVGVQALTFKKAEHIDPKTCSILVFAKRYGNSTEDKNLKAILVDLLPPSVSNCGSHFSARTMACAADSDDSKYDVYDPQFCQGNSGGPLMCSNDVVGLQTYIGNNCKQPHLYQLFFPWDNFITCGIEEKCQEELCGAICDAIDKDPPKKEVQNTLPVTHDMARDIISYLNVPPTTTKKPTTTESISMVSLGSPKTTTPTFATLTELVRTDDTTVNLPDVTTEKEIRLTTPDTTTTTILVELAVTEPTEKLTVIDRTSQLLETKQTFTSLPKLKKDFEIVKITSESSAIVMTNLNSWPSEKPERRTDDSHIDVKKVERKPQVEAQLAKQPIRIVSPAKRSRRNGGASIRNLSVFQTMLFGFTVSLTVFVI